MQAGPLRKKEIRPPLECLAQTRMCPTPVTPRWGFTLDNWLILTRVENCAMGWGLEDAIFKISPLCSGHQGLP